MKKYLWAIAICLSYFNLGAQDVLPSKPNTIEHQSKLKENDPYDTLIDRVEEAPDQFQTKFMNMLFMVALLIGFMIFASWFIKRMMKTRLEQMNAASNIQILETRYLNPKSTIYLLDVMGQGLLIAESHAGITHLATIPLEEQEKRS